MSQLCNMNYMFQTPSVLKTRGKKEGKPSPNLKPGAIPWCSSCSFLIAIPFIVQATHFTTRYLPHLSSAMHNCLCWYFMDSICPHQYKWDYLQNNRASKEIFTDQKICLPGFFTEEISWIARKKLHLMFWCFVILTIKYPKLNKRNTGFIIATTGRAHALMELCELWILQAFSSFGSGRKSGRRNLRNSTASNLCSGSIYPSGVSL